MTDATEKLRAAAHAAFKAPFAAVLKLSSNENASLWIDARQNPPQISSAPPSGVKQADCEWRAAPDVMARALSSERAVESAVINGRLVISGDMSVMARLKIGDA
ncbi:MAG: SCP2 sterol-binding domain-containing protein [Pseudomonadota bacterium]